MQVGHEFVGLGRPLYAPQQFALRVEDQVERDRPASVAFEQFLARDVYKRQKLTMCRCEMGISQRFSVSERLPMISAPRK